MIQITFAELKATYFEEQLADLLEILDHLHSAVSDGQNGTTMNRRELVAYLHDVIYVAQETITEIDKQVRYRPTTLHLVEKSTA